ncbi:immunoglobulin superfamily member 10 isoform X2 [Pristis pectinata]|uniref:immunoglobulin superfamily member 10 isoform X2 n=1 Tax=Pristis pectinata TaxID=685728 RepID=UPI00223D959B|nr:immunoglobulin superfamily member 10 isoform X2 [Pristis pectinata]
MYVVSGRGLSAFSLHWSLLVILGTFTWCWRVCLTCPKPCACYVPTEIHCTFRYLNTIPANIQAHVERINLGYNNLMKLTSDSFTGLKSLELLMLHSNKIQEIPDNTFKDLQSLQVLKMSYNKVKALNRETFHGLRNIVRLHMDHNNIEFINPEAFYGLTSLKLLHLEGNMLQELHRDTFVTFRFSQIFKVSSIKHLYLSDNAFTSIPSDLLSYISEIESIYLHGNKWFCDCNLKWLAELNERQPGVIKCKRDRNYPNGQICPLCANPSVSKGKDILQLPSSVFACTPPKIQSPLKIRNSLMEEEGDYAIVHAKDFVAPLGQMSLNMSDQSGNGCEITCNVHRPLGTPGVTLDQKEDYVLLNTSLSTFLVCYIDYEKIQRLWGILAMYTDSPLKLERDTLLSKSPSMSYLYKQPPTMDMQLFTGIQAEIRADHAWLLQSEITLQMDRSRTTLNILQIKYLVDVQVTLQDLEVKPGKNSWVMIKRASSVRTEHFVVMGGTVELECQAFGDPKPINEWILPDGSKVRAPYNSEDSRISVSADGQFRLRLADLYDTGIYHCIGTNYQDADVLSFRVTILDPNVSEKDINGPHLSKSTGESIHLPCQVSGIPNASVQWVLPDHRVLDHTAANKEITPNGTLRIKKLTVRHGGYYRCVASNRYGVDVLALQVTVTGPSEKDRAEYNDAAEDGAGSGESEEELLGSEEMGGKDSLLTTENTPEAEPDHASTPEPRTQPTTTAPRLVTPRRRMGASRARWWANRRTFKQPRRRVDPQRWAEYLEKARKSIVAKTATRGTTVKPQGTTQPTPEEGEASGEEAPNPAEEELMTVSTLRPRETAITRVSPWLRAKVAHQKESPVVARPPVQVHTVDPGAKEATTLVGKVPTDPSRHPVTIDSIYQRKPAQTSNPQQPRGDTLGSHIVVGPTAAVLVTDAPRVVSKGGAVTTRGYRARIMTIPTAIEDGDRFLFKATQKTTTPPLPLLSSAVTQQIHSARESDTDVSVSKPRQLGRRRKLTYRRRFGRPGLRKHRYSIVRPGQRRTSGSALTQSQRTSSVTEVAGRPPVRLPVPTQTDTGLAQLQGPGDPADPQVEKDSREVNAPEVTPTHRSHRSTGPDSKPRTPASKITTQPPQTPPSASPTPTVFVIKRPTERPPQISFSSNIPTTVQPTNKSLKVTRGKIPWDRFFGVNRQKEILRRLRKPGQGTRSKAVTHGTFTPTKPTLQSVGTSAPTRDPTKLLPSTARFLGTTTETSTPTRVTFTSTALPTMVGTVPAISQAVPTTPTTARTILTTRRTSFRRRRPGKPFGRTRDRVLSSRPAAGRNRAAESRKKRPMKTRMPLSPTVAVTTKASLPVAVETTWNPVPSPTTPESQYGPKLLALPSKNPPSQPIATSPMTFLTPTAKAGRSITTMGPPSTASKAIRLPRIRNRIRPTHTTVTPVTQTPSVSSPIAPMTEPSVHSTTPAATSSRSLSTFQPTSRATPRFRITLHKFDRGQPFLTPQVRVDTPPRENSHGRVVGTSQASLTEAPTGRWARRPTPNTDLENTIEDEDSREGLSSDSQPSSPNIIAVDPVAGNRPSKPSITSGAAASLTVLADSDAFMPCEATGNPLPTIRWTKISTANAKRGNKFEVFPNGTLSIHKIKVQDRGQYLCTAENQHGSDRLLVTLSVVAHPSKILEPRIKDITVHSGYPVEMKCRSQGRPSPTISWILSNRTMVRNSSPFNGRVSVLPDGTLRIKAVTVYDRGNYRCVASNPAGIDTVTVRMQVLAQPPTILEENRQSLKAQVGENIRLPCTAMGTPQPTIHWLIFDGTEIKPLQFVSMKLFVFTNGTLYVKSLTSSDSGNYECIATSSSGSEKRVVSLLVQRKQELPKIVAASPSKNKLNYGDKLQLHCSATGYPKPQILWRLPSKLLVDQWHRRGGRVVVLFNGTLSIESITEKDAGNYLCIARNKVGDDLMSVKIDVSMKPALIEHKQSIHKHVSYGGDLQVDCKASGAPKPEISWSLPDGTMVNNVLQADDNGRRTRRYVVFGNGTLYYNKVGMAEEGDYTCYAQNTLGKDEMKVHVTVVAAAPRIKKSYKPLHKAKVGESATFDCQAVGKPLPKILWMLPTNEIISFSKNRYHIHSNGSLLIKNIRLSDAGEYMCIARNPGGDDTDLMHLSVALTPPVINGFRGNRTVIKDTAVRHTRKQIDCKAEGFPMPRITWIMPDNILLNAPYYGSRIVVHSNGTLEIRNVRASDKAQFTCVARNNAGEATLVVNLDVTQMLRRPMFKNPFNEKFIASTGSTAVLNCSADGYPPPEIIWILPNGTRFTSRHKAAHYQMGSQGTFLIHSPTSADAGKYRCAARNKIGYIEKLIIFEVAQKPVIHTRSLGLVRSMSGDALSLHCSASGSPAPTIAWTVPSGFVLDRPQINAKYILFENGTLIIREISTHDRGNYICKAHNNAGVSSLVTPIMVIAYTPRITNGPPKSIQPRAGSSIQLNCMAIGIPKPEIVWELPNYTVLSTFSKVRPVGREYLHPQGTLVIQKVSISDSGTYKCTARSHLGSDSRVTFIQVI